MLAYLRLHKVMFTPYLKRVIAIELRILCKEFKKKESRIPNAPGWVYPD